MKQSSTGYTLIELIIAIAIGAIIIFGVTTTFTGSVQTSAVAIRNAQFEQEMRATMNTMVRDIRRAGYSSTATDDVTATTFGNNFLKSSGETVRLWDGSTSLAVSSTTPAPCITFAYDAQPTPDGALTSGSEDYRGFKKMGTSVYKRTSATATNVNCSSSSSSWSKLTSDDLVVDTLTFEWRDYTNAASMDPTVTPGATPTGCTGTPTAGDNTKALQRVIRITLTAHSAKDALLSRTLQDTVKVRNHAYNNCGA